MIVSSALQLDNETLCVQGSEQFVPLVVQFNKNGIGPAKNNFLVNSAFSANLQKLHSNSLRRILQFWLISCITSSTLHLLGMDSRTFLSETVLKLFIVSTLEKRIDTSPHARSYLRRRLAKQRCSSEQCQCTKCH